MNIYTVRRFSSTNFSDEITVVSKKTGEILVLNKYKLNSFQKFMSKIWNFFGSSGLDNYNYTEFEIYKDKTKIGSIEMENKSNNTLHIEWLWIKEKYQESGYGRTILETIIKESKKNGYKRITLEAPYGKTQKLLGTSPWVKEFYKSLGFTEFEDDGKGLLKMKLNL